ncbi:uncharacterized protein TRAVEDRAFT_69500 [Trametes versicolor FP-101664 SS1]|uniref:uncharacterized protein n=1 Tax=Trametes versicolor (strain FP-101664) TaxID=717944 RepID=UPI00046220EE|nr:uncharacterized protein TRAVEDRAFT_69500 [Trametes versicolor FP-101664 SS1]EIW63546.1 hypothetical protein TRAVEDRAFT_69500 [Trametes versicolor FP-101664 SS1]
MDPRAPSRQTSRAPTRQASRPPTRQANNPALAPVHNDPWPLTADRKDPASRKWFVLTHWVNSNFPEGTFVVLTKYMDYPITPTPPVRPGQEPAPGVEVQRTMENTTYQFHKLNIETRREAFSTQDGVNAPMTNVISFQPNGQPVPSSIPLEAYTPVYTIGAIPPIKDKSLPQTVPVPLNTRVLILGPTSRDGVTKALQSSGRHPVGRRYLLKVAVETEIREWEKCLVSLGSTSFRLPKQSERDTIQMLNKRPAPPKAVDTYQSDIVLT